MNDANEPPREPAGDAAAAPGDPVAALEDRLGVPLSDRALALAALTHKSYVNEHRDEAGLQDNERLEFLGDAVIDLAVSHRLMERFPGAREGELSKMRAAVVDEQGLSDMARALDLGGLLRLGRGEELTGGRRKASLLADAMEAVVAAVYLAGGLAAVLSTIDRFLGEAFSRAAAGTLDRDYKTQLQELAQSKLRATPRYRVVAEHGPDHSKTFEVETDLRGEVVGRGTGRSKKDAEQAAARLALDALAGRAGVAVPPGDARLGAGPAPARTSPAGPPGLSPAEIPERPSTAPPEPAAAEAREREARGPQARARPPAPSAAAEAPAPARRRPRAKRAAERRPEPKKARAAKKGTARRATARPVARKGHVRKR